MLGLVDVGAKVPVLDEGPGQPGIAVGYDLVDVFGIAAGGAGIVIAGAGGNESKAAATLGIDRSTLRRKLQRLRVP